MIDCSLMIRLKNLARTGRQVTINFPKQCVEELVSCILIYAV